MIGKHPVNDRTVIFLVLLFLTFESYSCDEKFNLLQEKVEKICYSKSNQLKDERINCGGKPSCPREFTKTTSCWDKTCAGEKATTPCPMLFFRTNAVLDAFCDHDGNWNFSNTHWVGKCTRLTQEEYQRIVDELLGSGTQEKDLTLNKVYVIFSWISLSFMIPSLLILFFFMDRKNIRFNFHKNLICAFLFRVVTYFINHYGELDQGDRTICNVFWILNRFFAVSEVTWMLNEAVYLLKLLFRTFDAKSYFWRFFAFGWGFPATLVLAVYIPVMVYYFDTEICWIEEKDGYYMFTLYGPMTLMLVINFFTLIYVIYVLLDKLRTSTTSELLRLKKGIKAALILMPLLGVIYLMILFVPKPTPTWYLYVIRILYPMQGTLACLVYVVFNGEVRQAMKTRWNRWIHTKAEFLERRREVADFLNGGAVGNQQINGVSKLTTVVQSDSHGVITCNIKKELTYDMTCSKMKQNASPTTPMSDGGDPERPLFPTGNHRR